jgi:hypothetical protein
MNSGTEDDSGINHAESPDPDPTQAESEDAAATAVLPAIVFDSDESLVVVVLDPDDPDDGAAVQSHDRSHDRSSDRSSGQDEAADLTQEFALPGTDRTQGFDRFETDLTQEFALPGTDRTQGFDRFETGLTQEFALPVTDHTPADRAVEAAEELAEGTGPTMGNPGTTGHSGAPTRPFAVTLAVPATNLTATTEQDPNGPAVPDSQAQDRGVPDSRAQDRGVPESQGDGGVPGSRGRAVHGGGPAWSVGGWVRGRVELVVGAAPRWVPPTLTIEGLVLFVLALRLSPGPLRGVKLDELGGLGLISVLPVTAFAAILLLILAFFVTLAQNTDRKGLLLAQLATITFALHGAAALVEAEPRFPTAWVHAGFAEYIARTGESLPGLDARFAWPGFFALFAFLTRAAGITDMTTVLQWTPLLSNLLYLLPFVLLLRLVVATTRARWFAALLFILVQWIGQDYFSPQGFTFALYLAFVAIVLRWFGRVAPRAKPVPGGRGVRRLLARLDALTPGELSIAVPSFGDRVVMLVLLVAVFAAATTAHQITPFMMLGALTGLILLRRTSLSVALPFLLGLVVLAWISYQATSYWSGNIGNIFGGIGHVFENLQQNTGDRLAGTDPQHAWVLRVRLGICGVILALAGVGLLRRLRRGVGDRAALLLLCVPVLALGLQSYGGEIGLRIYLFALPGACILAAYAFFPNLPAGTADPAEETVPVRRRNTRFEPRFTRRASLVLAAVCALALSMAFLVARYGNEKFERVTTGEVAAMHYVYDHDKPNARLFYLVPAVGQEMTPTIPWRERDIEDVEYLEVLVTPDPAMIDHVVSALRSGGANTYVMASQGQAHYMELNNGFPAGWGPRFRAALDAAPQLRRVFSNESAAIYTIGSSPKGPIAPQSQAYELLGDESSPLTPLGLGALAVSWAALFGYEVMRLRGLDRHRRNRRYRRRLLTVGMVTLVVAVAVVIERFLVIGLV